MPQLDMGSFPRVLEFLSPSEERELKALAIAQSPGKESAVLASCVNMLDWVLRAACSDWQGPLSPLL